MPGFGSLLTIHVVLSLVALGTGFLVMPAALGRPVPRGWTAVFIGTAVATSLTGFLFPYSGPTPAFVTGILACIVFALMLLARAFAFAGGWQRVHAVGLVASLYFLVLAGITQAFLKIAPLQSLAPTGSEPPLAIVQGLVLLGFLWLGWRAARGRRRVFAAPA